MDAIQFVGTEKLTLSQLTAINNIAKEEYDIISRMVGGELGIKVHIKESHKDGKRHLFEAHVHIMAPSKVAHSTKASDWDLKTAVHKGFDDVKNHLMKANNKKR